MFLHMTQLRKSLRTANFYPGSIVATQGDITAFIVDDPDAVFLMDADEYF